MNDFVEVFSSEQGWKSDMLMEELEHAGIPCYLEHSMGGVELGTYPTRPYAHMNIVKVPAIRLRDAKEILSDMPFDTAPQKTSPQEWEELKRQSWNIVIKMVAISGSVATLFWLLLYYGHR